MKEENTERRVQENKNNFSSRISDYKLFEWLNNIKKDFLMFKIQIYVILQQKQLEYIGSASFKEKNICSKFKYRHKIGLGFIKRESQLVNSELEKS